MTPERRQDSGLHAPLAKATRRPSNPGVDVLLEIGDLPQAGRTRRQRFDALVAAMRRAVPFEAVALALRDEELLLYSAKDTPEDRERVAIVAGAASAYFVRGASLYDYVALVHASDLRWVCLPLVGEGDLVLGLLAVGAPDREVDEATVTLVAGVARHIGRGLVRGPARPEAESTHAAVEPVATTLTDVALSSFDYLTPLADLCHRVAERFDGACLIDVEGVDGERHHVAEVPDGRANAFRPNGKPVLRCWAQRTHRSCRPTSIRGGCRRSRQSYRPP